MAMVRSADKPRDKAFIAVLYEGGFRIGEILSAKVGDVEFDENGARLKVHGKTGSRTVRLITSVPLLARLLEEHPFRNDPMPHCLLRLCAQTRAQCLWVMYILYKCLRKRL